MKEKELFIACGLEGKPDVEKVRELLKRDDIDFNERSVEFHLGLMTPLELVCRNGYLEIVELLLEDPRVQANSSNLSGVSLFYTVCTIGHLEIVKYMLMNERIISHFKQPKIIGSAFIDSCTDKHLDVGKWILASGRNIPKENIESTKNSLEKNKDKNEKVVKLIQLLEKFLLDPIQTRKELRKELGLPGLIFFLILILIIS